MKKITFPTHNPFVLKDMREPKIRENPVDGIGYLFMPKGPARGRPAVVVLEGLGGLKDAREMSYGRKLAERGYVALVVDTFGTRDAAKYIHTRRALVVTEAMMLADAFGALSWLGRHPAVDASRICVMGFSYGGMCTVLTAYEQMGRLFAPEGHRFAGHIAYYGCSVPRLEDPTTTGAPVKIMLGELDKNVSVSRTCDIAEDLRRGGSDVELTVFPGTYHQWDADDVKPRFVLFSLAGCEMMVDRDDTIRDTLTGLRVTGPVSRTAVLARGVRMSGYHILRCEDTIRQSDAALFEFLAKVSGRQAYPVRPPERRAAAG